MKDKTADKFCRTPGGNGLHIPTECNKCLWTLTMIEEANETPNHNQNAQIKHIGMQDTRTQRYHKTVINWFAGMVATTGNFDN